MELKYEFYVGAQPEQVWHALVSPEGTCSSFFGSVLKSSLQEGDPFEYVGPGNDGDQTVHVYGRILTCVPNQELSYIEHPGPTYNENHGELESRVTFRLETAGACTKLTLINDRWTPDHPAFHNAEKHWWMIMSSIKTFAESGKTLDFGW